MPSSRRCVAKLCRRVCGDVFSFSGYYLYQTGVPLYRVYSVSGVGQGTVSVTADSWDSHRLDDYSTLDLRETCYTITNEGRRMIRLRIATARCEACVLPARSTAAMGKPVMPSKTKRG